MTVRVHRARQKVYFEGGNAYGYHQMITRLEAALAPYVTWDDDAPVSFHMRAPMVFDPTPGKRNVLLSMFESKDMPQACADRIRQADACIVPSRFCQNIFEALTRARVYRCALGVDPLPYHPRTFGTPFRWLWVGAFNLRKGFQTAAAAWDEVLGALPHCELYVKTTMLGRDDPGTVERHRGSLILDTRNLPTADLHALYRSAHAFVFPTLGEGFGLTLAEAMMSGLPVVATEYGGHLDFCTPQNSVLIPCRVKRIAPGGGEAHITQAADGKYEFATLKPRNLARAMLDTMAQYDAAIARAARARVDVERLTWDACARRVAGILARETMQIREAA